MNFFPQFDPYSALEEIAKLNSNMAGAIKNLNTIKDQDVQIATTEKTAIFQQDKVTLYHYKARAKQSIKAPVLVVYGLIGRYTMADLQEDRSLIRNLLDQGVDVYAVDWGSPTRADRWLQLEDYIQGYLADCVDLIKKRHKISKINLFGICEGGVFSLCYAALYPRNIKNLITSITPIDFHADQQDNNIEHGYINLWTRNLAADDIDMIIKSYGNIPGELMGMVFQLLTPLKSMTKYNIDLLEVAQDEKKLLNFLRMEKWLADRPDHPGEAAKQWFKDLYQDNKLINNTFELGGKKIKLNSIKIPILNIFALNDHIIPPACSMALKDHIGTKDYTALPIPSGHVGVFVSGKSQGIISQGVFEWLADRD